jgi:hypothetical protein
LLTAGSEQAEASARRQNRGHIYAPWPVSAQPDGGLLAWLKRELTLAVDGDDARPCADRMNRSGAHPLDPTHPYRHDQPRCDGGEDLACRTSRNARGDPV